MPATASAAIASSGRSIVWAAPSSVTGIGVAWLPTTWPRAVHDLRVDVRLRRDRGAAVGELERRLADACAQCPLAAGSATSTAFAAGVAAISPPDGLVGAIGSVFWPVIAVSEPRRGSG